MDTSIEWIWEDIGKYTSLTNKQPFFPSDWDTEVDAISYPHQIIEQALEQSKKDSNLYCFSDDQTETKEIIKKYLNLNNNAKIGESNIAFSINSTNALYLSLCALKKTGITRFLVITPTYYSIIDSLRDLGCNIFFYHLRDLSAFSLDIDFIQDAINEQFVEAVILTDPIYSTGISIGKTSLTQLCNLTNDRGVWLLIDGVLGNMPWDMQSNYIIDVKSINEISKTERFIFIDSVTKRFQINGIKSSIILASPDIRAVIENISCQISGGFCNAQIKLLQGLFREENLPDLLGILSKNIELIKKNYNLLKSGFMDTEFDLYNSTNGYFTVAYSKFSNIEDLNTKEIIRAFLYQFNLQVLPLTPLCFYNKNRFGFRINLLKPLMPLIPCIHRAIRINLNRPSSS